MLLTDTKTSEKLRSKHVRTLELLQKTLDENVDLRDQIGRLQKVRRRVDGLIFLSSERCVSFQGSLHLGQGFPQSSLNRATELEDKIDRLKAEQHATTLALEEAARVRHAEFTSATEMLQKKTLRLQNQVVTLETTLGQAQGKLSTETAHWRGERAQFVEENRRLCDELDALRDPAAGSNCDQQQYERELQRLRGELVAATDSEREARGLERDAQDRATRLQSAVDTLQQHINAQYVQINTLQQQFASAKENEAAHTKELSALREQQRDQRSQLVQLQREASQQPESNALQHASVLTQLRHVEAANEQLRSDNHTLQEQVARLHAQQHYGGSVFAVHVELKHENFQLRAQIEELKQLQKRFLLTAAKKTTMRFPAL